MESKTRQIAKAKTTETEIDEAPEDQRDAGLDDDYDTILDEIDSVLEENAEGFVRSFVQKGGQ